MTEALPIINLSTTMTPSFILVFARISAMMFIMPFFSSSSIPVKVRVMISVVLAFIVLPSLSGYIPIENLSFGNFTMAIVREIAIGLTIGFGGLIIFEAISFAGMIAGRQMGLGMLQLFDPSLGMQTSLVGQFWLSLMLIIFLSLGMHNFLIGVIFQNFQHIPPGAGVFTPELGHSIVKSSNEIFTLGVKLAAPAIVFMLSIDTAIALMARIMPTLPVFIIALPLKMAIGLYVVSISMQIFQTIAGVLYNDFQNVFQKIIFQLT